MYSISYQVPAPIEAYDALHTAVKDVTATDGEGLLVHIARPTEKGFEIIEVWESQEQFGAFITNTLPKAVANLGGMGDMQAPPIQEFQLRGFLVYAKDKIVI
jgi:heme-degrading monooxygenase HmoA